MALTTVDGGLLSSTNAQYTGFKNRIINGAMVIDQRNAGSAFTLASGTNAYGSCDRWASIASSAVWTMQQVSTGNFDFTYALRVKRNAAAAASTLYYGQVIETNNCTDLAGQAVTVSFYATAGANFSGTFTVEIWTGTGTNQGWNSLGSATWTGQTLASSNTLVPTTTRTRYSYSATLGASVAEVAIRFTYSATGTAGANDYIDITGVQLEKGSTATSFDYRPYGTELALCQRYCMAWRQVSAQTYLASGQCYFTTSALIMLPFPVTPRVVPTSLTVSSPADFGALTANGSASTGSAVTINSASIAALGVNYVATASVFVAGNATSLYTQSAATNAYIYTNGSEL